MSDTVGSTLVPPPRLVPLLVRMHVIFGGGISQVGWALLCVGSVVLRALVLNSDFPSWYYFSGELETAKGAIISSDATHVSEGGDGPKIVAYRYSFRTPDGQEHEGVSYAAGQQLKLGTPVAVEYPKDNPAVSRIKGHRRALFPGFLVVFGILPLVGLCLVYAGLRRGLIAARLLANGNLAPGTLKSKQPTNTRINNQTVYKFTFEFLADDGKTYQATARTHRVQRMDSEPRKRLLYDPLDPSRTVLFDNLPGSPGISELGDIQARSTTRPLLVLLLPILAIVVNVAYSYIANLAR